MKKIQHKLIVILAIVFTSTLIPAVLVLANPYKILQYTQPQAELYVGRTANRDVYDPVSIICEYEPCQTFTVYVKVRNITDLWGVSFYMNYNPAVLNCTAVRYGADWGTLYTDYIAIPGTINRTKGSIEAYDGSRMAGALPTNSTLYAVDFHMLNWGESVLNMSGTPTELRDSLLQLIYCPITDGYFNCPLVLPAYGPTAVFTYSPVAPLASEVVTFNASASLPGFNGTVEVPIANYTWDFDDGNVTTVTDPVIYHAFAAAGDYIVNLTVTCNDDPVLIANNLVSNSTWKTVTVTPLVVYGPTADFTFSPPTPSIFEIITFNASASLPGWNGTHETPIVNYAWDFGDGTPIVTETDPITTYNYTLGGNYNVVLNVTDSQALWNTTSKAIKITAFTQPQGELYVGRTANRDVYDPVNITCEYEPCQTFTVYVKVRNITDLWGVSFYMNYNPAVLNCTAVRYGTDWGTPFTDYLSIPGTINRTKGSIEGYDASRMAAALPTNATLYAVDFHMLDWGESVLNMSGTPTELRAQDLSIISVPITDGYFKCPLLLPAYGPVAVFTYSPLAPLTNEVMTFNASASLSGFNGTHDAPIVSYAWNFGDGSPIVVEFDPVTTYSYALAGDYNVVLNVTDSQGFWNTTSKTITVTQPVPLGPPVRVYLEPSTITATEVGQSFTVEIRINNVTDLFALQTGLTWDPNRLEINISGPHNGFAFGAVWGTFGSDYISTVDLSSVNNVTGEIYPPFGATRLATGINGTNLVLAYIDFVAKVNGTSNVHLAEIMLLNSKSEEIPTSVVDVFTVIVEENPPFYVITVHNLTGSPLPPLRLRLTNHTFSQENKKISFNITGPIGTAVFWNVTIPKSLMHSDPWKNWTILLDGVNITASVTLYENATHTSFYFAFNRTLYTHKIEIQGSWVVPEFPLVMILPLLMIVALAVVFLGKKFQLTKQRGPSPTRL